MVAIPAIRVHHPVVQAVGAQVVAGVAAIKSAMVKYM